MASDTLRGFHSRYPCRSPFDLPPELDAATLANMRGLRLEELPGFRSIGAARSPGHRRVGHGMVPVEGIAEDSFKTLEDMWDATWGSSRAGRNNKRVGLGCGDKPRYIAGARGLVRPGGLLKLLGFLRRWLGITTEEVEDTEDESDATEDVDAEEYRYGRWLEECNTEKQSSLQTLPGFHSDGLSSRVYSGVTDEGSLPGAMQSRNPSSALSLRHSSAKSEEEARLASEGLSRFASAEPTGSVKRQGIGAGWEHDASLSSSPLTRSSCGCATQDATPTKGCEHEAGFSSAELQNKGGQIVEPASAVDKLGSAGSLGKKKSRELARISSQKERDMRGELLRSASEYELVKEIWDQSWHGGHQEEDEGSRPSSKGFRKVRLFVRALATLGVPKFFSKRSESIKSKFSTDDRPFIPAPLHSVYSIRT